MLIIFARPARCLRCRNPDATHLDHYACAFETRGERRVSGPEAKLSGRESARREESTTVPVEASIKDFLKNLSRILGFATHSDILEDEQLGPNTVVDSALLFLWRLHPNASDELR